MVVEPPVHLDERGRYVCYFDSVRYKFTDTRGADLAFHEDCFSVSRRDVLRGLHGDERTWKLIQVPYGRIFFAVADLRPDSPTYLNTETFELGGDVFRQVLVPAGCVNGHLCLTDSCVFSYKQSQIYSGAEKQWSVAWNDPKFAIPWPIAKPILSKRDREARPWGER